MVKSLDEGSVKQRGMILETLFKASEELFLAYQYQVIKQKPETIQSLRTLLQDHFGQNKKSMLLCNYSMPIAGQGNWWGGHISPIAAFDEQSDSALIMDVWIYTDPFWINLENLHAATVISTDADSNNSRGFVQIK